MEGQSMTEVERLATFVTRASYEALSTEACQALKSHTLDSLGCAIGALAGPPIKLLREHLEEFGGRPLATMIGDGRTAPDRAAFYNSALIRYLDFNDSFLAKGETCHPSDNVGAVLTASEYAGTSGKEFLTAMAVAYQLQCRLSEVAPVRAKGFDHVTQGAYAAAAGVARALRLDVQQTAHAIAISGTAFNALRVTRTGRLSHWKGLAYPNTAFSATYAAFLAKLASMKSDGLNCLEMTSSQNGPIGRHRYGGWKFRRAQEVRLEGGPERVGEQDVAVLIALPLAMKILLASKSTSPTRMFTSSETRTAV
jgi:2-methylcitrate dehydratase